MCHFADDLLGILVFAQPSEGSMTQLAVGRPGPELDFGDQFRPDMEKSTPFLWGQLVVERALVRFDRRKPVEELLRHGDRKAGADAADMDQTPFVVNAHCQ